MADETQLEILLKGVEEWNKWRNENPRIEIDLQGAELQRASLRGASLWGADLQGANFQGADLRNANLPRADLKAANFHEASLQDTNFSGSNLQGANLSEADLRKAHLPQADLREAELQGADLRNAYLGLTDLREADFHKADLRNAKFLRADLRLANLRATNLRQANFEKAKIQYASLQNANLKYVVFSEADLQNANLAAANLWFIKYDNANFLSAYIKDATTSDKIYSELIELGATKTEPPKRPNNKETRLFISYAREELNFVTYLENRLKEDRLEYWLDIREMVPGPIDGQITDAIDERTTVLVVISKTSLVSGWVLREVELAERIRESLQAQGSNRHVLCPISVDNSWRDPKVIGQTLGDLLTKYFVLDYSNWENPETAEETYQTLKSGLARWYQS